MSSPLPFRRGLVRGLAGLLLLASCAGLTQAGGDSSVWTVGGSVTGRRSRFSSPASMAWRDIRTSVLRQFPLMCRRQAVDGEIITPRLISD
jgi:hypothetical protein